MARSKAPVEGELHHSTRKFAFGAIAYGLVNVSKIGLQLLLLPIMARFLGPDEFGLYALALPVVSFVALLADGGLGASLAREPESSSVVWSTAFWVLLFTGVALASCTSAFGLLLGYLLQQPRIPPIIAALSLSMILLVLSVTPSARLYRRRNLWTGAIAEFVANIAGAVIALLLAADGAGAWSLVAQYLTIYAGRAVILNSAAFRLPTLEFKIQAIRPHVISGGFLVGARLSEYGGRFAENVLFGRFFGTALLGSFTFANQVSRFSTEAVGNVTFAALYAQSLTSNATTTAKLHRKLCRLLGLTLFPAIALVATAAPELTQLLLGPKWTELTFLLRVLLPISALTIIATQIGAVLLPRGRFEIQFWCIAGLCLGRVLTIGAGPWIGYTAVVYGIAAVGIIYFVALSLLGGLVAGCRPIPVMLDLVGPLVSSIAAAAIVWIALDALPKGLAGTTLSLASGLVAFAVTMFALDRKSLSDDWLSLRELLSSRQQSPNVEAE